MKFGIFLEIQHPRPWDPGQRAAALPEHGRADRARRRARHRLRLGGRAPLPRGVLALLRARDRAGRGGAQHEAHPARPRHRGDAAQLQPPRPRRGAHRHARPRLGRPRRVRHGRDRLAQRAGGLRRAARGQARDVARGQRAGREHARARPLPRLRGQVLLDALPQRGPEGRPATAPADVDGLLQPRGGEARRPARPRRALLLLPPAGRGRRLDRRLLRRDQDGVRPDRPLRERQLRDRRAALPRSRRRRRLRARAAQPAVLQHRRRPLLRRRPPHARPHEPLEHLRGLPRAPRGRAHAPAAELHRHARGGARGRSACCARPGRTR